VAEALNLGAYDLLAKPFDTREVLYAVTTACRHSETEHEMTPARERVMTAKRSRAAEMRVSAAVGR
jgi:DNA-binding response OmpR family regulator